MRKFLSLVSALCLLSTSASSVVACTDDKEYNQFMKWVKDDQSFVFFIGAWDCADCQANKLNLWNKLTANNDAYLKTELQKTQYKPDTVYGTASSPQKTAYANLHLYNYEIQQVAKAFDDDNIKKIADYMVDQSKAKLKNTAGQVPQPYLTRQDLGVDGLPLFIFIDHGTYQGFFKGKFTQPKTAVSLADVFMNAVVKHIVHHNWTVSKS